MINVKVPSDLAPFLAFIGYLNFTQWRHTGAPTPATSLKKDKYRRKGKGRFCCFALGRFVEEDELQQDDMKQRMNISILHNRPSAKQLALSAKQ